MAQLLISFENRWYQNIASVKNYYEKDFENKILKYAGDIFSNYHVLKCKTFDIVDKTDRSNKKRPDFLLISKNFKSWIIVEVETCGKQLNHTQDQIKCFLNPEYNISDFHKYLIDQNPYIELHKLQLLDILENRTPSVLVIFDDYCQKTFTSLTTKFKDIKICVMETYRTSDHPSEAYRISGEYPYEISGISQLRALEDGQHFEVMRPDLLKEIDEGTDIDLNYYMRTIRARLLRTNKKTFLKIPENPLPPDINIELNINLAKSLIIKRL